MTGRSITFTPSEADVLAAYRLHWSKIPRKAFVRFSVLVLAVAAFVVLMVQPGGFLATSGTVAAIIAYAIILFVVLRWISLRWWLPRFVRRVYEQQADLRRSTTTHWDEEYFRSESSEGGFRTAWRDLYGWRRDRRNILLYRSEILFNFIVIGDAEQAAIDDLERCLTAAEVRAL